jgi:hypothetical protein
MLKQRVEKVAQALVNAAKGNPMECILAAVAVGVGITSIYTSRHDEYRLFYYPMLFLLTNIANKLTVNHQKRWAYYAVSLLSLVAFVLFKVEPSDSYYVVALGCVSLAYLSFPLYRDNERFAENVLNNVVALLFAGFVSGVVFLLTVSIKLSLSYLFDLHSSGKDIESIAILVWIGFYPILFLAFNDNSLRLTLKNRFTEILFNYILTPAIIIYMLIFYAYFVKVALQWELPKGNVAYMVFGFGIAAYLLKMVSSLLSKDYFGWLYRNLSYFVLPALVLFWVGTIYRVNEYGFTEDRIYLLIGGVFLTVTSLVLISNKLGRYLYLSLGIIVVLSVFTYIPFMSAKTLGIKSQEHRFEKALKTLGYTKLDSAVHFKPLANTPENRKAISTLTSSFRYIYKNAEKEYTAKHLGVADTYQLENIITSENYALGSESSDYSSQKMILYNSISALNIHGYNTMVILETYSNSKRGNYYQYEGSQLDIYYKDKKIFTANKDSLLKSQLAKAGVSLRDASEDGQPLTEQQQQLLYRIEIPGGVALVRSYDVSEDPYKVEEVDLYGILLK